MNYNFTEGCRKLLQSAREAAVELGDEFIGTEHMLLGALGDGEVGLLLGRLGVQPTEVRSLLMNKLSGGRREPGTLAAVSRPWRRTKLAPGELPYSSRAKKALELAMAEAREGRGDHVGSQHILIGLVREERGLAAQVLADLGVTLERARAARAGEEVEPRSRLRVTIDDASDRSIYEQIVAQVTEAVATGLLRPGERLPTVRQLADELDIAPGTVARAYSELERQKLVVTEGARGTRVAERAGTPPSDENRPETLTGLLRPVAVAAFHLGGTADELRAALEEAMRGIFDRDERAA